jgi:hypothetical protein
LGSTPKVTIEIGQSAHLGIFNTGHSHLGISSYKPYLRPKAPLNPCMCSSYPGSQRGSPVFNRRFCEIPAAKIWCSELINHLFFAPPTQLTLTQRRACVAHPGRKRGGCGTRLTQLQLNRPTSPKSTPTNRPTYLPTWVPVYRI